MCKDGIAAGQIGGTFSDLEIGNRQEREKRSTMSICDIARASGSWWAKSRWAQHGWLDIGWENADLPKHGSATQSTPINNSTNSTQRMVVP
jgi:hypothetical protein